MVVVYGYRCIILISRAISSLKVYGYRKRFYRETGKWNTQRICDTIHHRKFFTNLKPIILRRSVYLNLHCMHTMHYIAYIYLGQSFSININIDSKPQFLWHYFLSAISVDSVLSLISFVGICLFVQLQ